MRKRFIGVVLTTGLGVGDAWAGSQGSVGGVLSAAERVVVRCAPDPAAAEGTVVPILKPAPGCFSTSQGFGAERIGPRLGWVWQGAWPVGPDVRLAYVGADLVRGDPNVDLTWVGSIGPRLWVPHTPLYVAGLLDLVFAAPSTWFVGVAGRFEVGVVVPLGSTWGVGGGVAAVTGPPLPGDERRTAMDVHLDAVVRWGQRDPAGDAPPPPAGS